MVSPDDLARLAAEADPPRLAGALARRLEAAGRRDLAADALTILLRLYGERTASVALWEGGRLGAGFFLEPEERVRARGALSLAGAGAFEKFADHRFGPPRLVLFFDLNPPQAEPPPRVACGGCGAVYDASGGHPCRAQKPPA